MSIAQEIQRLDPSALIEMFEIDATADGGEVFYFYNGLNELGHDVVWQGQTYTNLAITAEGFEFRSGGTLPRPTLVLSNIGGIAAAEARAQNYFLGAKVTRRQTYSRFLDAVNFAAGNPEADPGVHLRDEIWYVDRKAGETPTTLSFELASALDLIGVRLPRRQMPQNTCPWVYRGEDCNYQGGPVADANDQPTSDPAVDRCSQTLKGCKMRFGAAKRLPIGSFPGVGLFNL